jgi:glucose/arabinose dehydrogenase
MAARTLALLLAGFLLLGAVGCGDDDGDRPAQAPEPTGEEPAVGSGQGGVRLTEIGQFDEPLYATQPPGRPDELFVVEKGGRIMLVRDGEKLDTPFLDLSDRVSNGFEQGLLSVAFAPDYEDSGLFYVDYTEPGGDTRIEEYKRASATRADPGSRREILSQDQPFDNHNGGLLLFGPDDHLYVGFGDGGSAGDPSRNGQNLNTVLGKILRIDPRPDGDRPYGIPDDNPFVGKQGRDEIYSYGLRNPWRFSFDRKTEALSIGDVGQNEFEEVDYVGKGEGSGANFGWSAFEGDQRLNPDQEAPDHVPPVLTYPLSGGNCSVTGGYVVRDRALRSLSGRYVYADFCKGEVRSFVPSEGSAEGDRALGLSVPSLSSFGEDLEGHIYATSLEGPVYRLDPS